MKSEIVSKQRRISELERRLRVREQECDRLKSERDRLVAISNDLRAELNMLKK